MILALGNSEAFEVVAFESVVTELKRKGHEAVLFKQDKCLEGEYLVFEIANGQQRCTAVIDGKNYDVSEFSAIWHMKPRIPFELIEFKPAEYRQFIHRQFRSMRTAIWSIFRHKKWIDNPWNVEIAEDKLFQLDLACKVGFSIPDTIVTSDPERIRSFYRKHSGNVIVKVLRASPIIGKVLSTNRVTTENLTQIDSVKRAPSIFQVCVEKAYELRITVVGEKIFSAKIHSQEDEATSLDWRKKPKLNDFDVRMEQNILPSEVEQKILQFMDMISLRFGCIDMIVTPENEYIFLEINPNGQWYFVQLNTEAKIAKSIAELLV